jgi:hypothetical protein
LGGTIVLATKIGLWTTAPKHMHGADPRGCGVLELQFELELVLANELAELIEMPRALR